jgi:hypothetical protein
VFVNWFVDEDVEEVGSSLGLVEAVFHELVFHQINEQLVFLHLKHFVLSPDHDALK